MGDKKQKVPKRSVSWTTKKIRYLSLIVSCLGGSVWYCVVLCGIVLLCYWIIVVQCYSVMLCSRMLAVSVDDVDAAEIAMMVKFFFEICSYSF